MIDLNNLVIRGCIQPNADAPPIHIYGATRDRTVDTGDIAYRRREGQVPAFYRVTYGSTLPYPPSPCAGSCSPYPYQLFIQRERIADSDEIKRLAEELGILERLPF